MNSLKDLEKDSSLVCFFIFGTEKKNSITLAFIVNALKPFYSSLTKSKNKLECLQKNLCVTNNVAYFASSAKTEFLGNAIKPFTSH
jgi:hypothetical protein